jgi:cyclophilin family peptidyl-prolyl cis-trans isomerase
MPRFASTLWASLRRRPVSRRAPRLTARLAVEVLERREVPAALLGSITATAYVDLNGDGKFDAGDQPLSAVPVTLSGPIHGSMTTGANGAATFSELSAGTYQIQFNVPGYNGSGLVSNITLAAGQNVSVSVPYTGISSTFINQSLFLNDTGAAPFRFIAPTVTTVIPNQTGTVGTTQDLDLAGFFNSAALTTSQVTMNVTDNGQTLPLNITLYDGQTPQNVDNFYDYVNSGRYNSAPFTRLVSGFVLQGGGATFSGTNPNGTLTPTTKFPEIPGEPGLSNIKYTIATAQSNGVNTGQDEFFFNLANNTQGAVSPAGNLDAQHFTVFGEATGANDQAILNTLATTPNLDESSSGAASSLSGVVLNNFPLNNASITANDPNFPKQTSASDYLLMKSFTVNRPYSLTYSIVSNSSPSVVTASMVNEQLQLTGVSAGTSTITVQATDPFGKSVQQLFTITVA